MFLTRKQKQKDSGEKLTGQFDVEIKGDREKYRNFEGSKDKKATPPSCCILAPQHDCTGLACLINCSNGL